MRYTKLLRPQRDGCGVISRDKNDWSRAPFRANAFRDVEAGTVRQFKVHHIGIKSFLFDSAEGIGNRLAYLDITLLIGEHPLNDSTDRHVVVYH